MLDILFENRNRTLGNLIKLGDALGRSIRENVILFSMNSEDETVTYLSESGKLVTGYYDLRSLNPKISQIKILDSKIMNETQNFDTFVSKKVRSFINHLNEDKGDDAQVSFNEVLSLWEGRLKLESYQKKLYKKSEVVKEKTSIVETKEFQNFLEIKDSLTNFLKENREELEQIDEIKNTVTLSNLISNAFDLPRVELDSLEGDEFSYSETHTGSLYEMICRQELLRKELMESKKEFGSIWAGSNKVTSLMGYIYESDDNISKALAEAIAQVPYLALASKAQLRSIFTDSIAVNESISISNKEISGFASKIFEMKKPVKEAIVNVLNEKYGINIQNLKETASFRSLVNTQIVLFETLAKLSPANSVQREVLSEVSTMLKNKAGVEALDLNDEILDLFEGAEMAVLHEANVESYLDFNKIADDIEGITAILRMIQAKVGGMDAGMGMQQPGMEQPGMEQPGMEQPGMGMDGPPDPLTNPDPQAEGDMEMPAAGVEDDDVGAPAMAPDQVPGESEEEAEMLATQGPPEEQLPSEEDGEMGDMEQPPSGDDLMANIADLQSLIDDLSREIQGEGGGEEMPEEGMEGEIPEEGEEEEGEEFGSEEGMEDEDGEAEPEEDEGGEEEPKKERPKGKKKFRLQGKDKALPQEKVD